MTLLQAAIAVLQEGQEIKGEQGFVAVPRSAMVALTEATLREAETRSGLGLSATFAAPECERIADRFTMVADAIEGPRG